MKLPQIPSIVFALVVCALPWNASAQMIFLVRHAERADGGAGTSPMMAADPDLSDAGRARAEALLEVLKDAKITAIFTTEYKRSHQTAAPLAKALGLVPTTIKATERDRLLKELAASKTNVLVIGHSNTLPEIIKGLGAPAPPAIGDNEYDNLYVVTLGPPASVVRLHFD